VLKRKEEKSEAISVRVPASRKAQEDLRRQADAAGFDLTATIVDALTRLSHQVLVEVGGKGVKIRSYGKIKVV
jgi:hypothetical protein